MTRANWLEKPQRFFSFFFFFCLVFLVLLSFILWFCVQTQWTVWHLGKTLDRAAKSKDSIGRSRETKVLGLLSMAAQVRNPPVFAEKKKTGFWSSSLVLLILFLFLFLFFFFVLLLAECHAFGSNCCQSKQSGQKRSFCRCLGLRKRDYG